MTKAASPARRAAESPIHERILGAAFQAFTEEGYAGTSTLDIATRAKVSKRDLYANFASKHAVLVACIKSRADRIRPSPDLPAPNNRQMLASTLTAFATNLVLEISHPSVIATFRLAIAEATRSPEIAQALDTAGRDATRGALAELLASAQAARTHWAGRASRDGDAIFGARLGGADGGLAIGGCRDARASRSRAAGNPGDGGVYAITSRSRHRRIALTPQLYSRKRSPPFR